MTIPDVCASAEDERELRLALLDELQRAVPFDAFAWLLTDPETEVGTAPIADVPCLPDLPTAIRLKYATSINRWTTQSAPVARLHAVTSGSLEKSLLWRELLGHYGITDIASVVFRDRFGCWSFLDLWRIGGVFTDAEESRLEAVTASVTSALRRCVAASFTPAAGSATVENRGPIVLVLDSDLTVTAQTPDTDDYLRMLVPPDGDAAPVPAAAYNVAAQLLANEDGVDDHPPVARVRLDLANWLTLRAARINRDIAVSIESSSLADRQAVYCRATGMTTREREILDHLATGADTRTIAKDLFLSEHTVQDHLKSMFTKSDTRSRKELLARVSGR